MSNDDAARPDHEETPAAARLWPARAPRQRRPVLRPLLLAVAVVLAAAAAGMWWSAGRGPASFTDLADCEPLPSTAVDMRGAGSPALATIFSLGMSHYADGDWTAAVEQLARAERMLAADPTGGPPNQPLFQPFLRMYLGVSLLQAGRTDEALPVFDALARPEIALPLRERGLWYGAQCRLLLGDGVGAVRQLDELGGSPVYAQLARDLAARVRERLGS
ncbi:MAG: hypothetical protein IPJ24_06665 [bacterium]|nr:hypothetical protein [bacterium]